MATDPSAPKGYTHGKPANLQQPPLGGQVGLDGNPDPINLTGRVGPRASQANKPDPRLSPGARAALERSKGGADSAA
jgi:hypothetical protein